MDSTKQQGVNEWRISVARNSRCKLCKNNLRRPCPYCVARGIQRPCWVLFRRNGNYHEHCCMGRHEMD